MTSVERILEYCDLESEAAPETEVKPPPNWPSNGNIVFDNMSLAYHKSLPNVLHNISCNIKPKEKVLACAIFLISAQQTLSKVCRLKAS